MNNFMTSLVIIFFGLTLGYLLQVLITSKRLHLPKDMTRKQLSLYLQRIALLGLNPIALTGALWIVDLNSIKLFALPFLGMTAILLGGLLAFLYASHKHMPNKQKGAYIISGAFTNIGVIGGLVSFVLLGEIGYALVPLYKLFEELLYYGVGFPLAKGFSTVKSDQITALRRIKNISKDIFIRVALTSITLGLILNFTGVNRPDFYGQVNGIIIPLTTILLLTSIGLNLRFSKMSAHIKPALIIILVKMLIVPLIVTTIAFLLGLHKVNDGLPLKVVLILSSMPTGFIAMVPPALYDLDGDLANTVWFATSLALFIVIPWLSFATGSLL